MNDRSGRRRRFIRFFLLMAFLVFCIMLAVVGFLVLAIS